MKSNSGIFALCSMQICFIVLSLSLRGMLSFLSMSVRRVQIAPCLLRALCLGSALDEPDGDLGCKRVQEEGYHEKDTKVTKALKLVEFDELGRGAVV